MPLSQIYHFRTVQRGDSECRLQFWGVFCRWSLVGSSAILEDAHQSPPSNWNLRNPRIQIGRWTLGEFSAPKSTFELEFEESSYSSWKVDFGRGLGAKVHLRTGISGIAMFPGVNLIVNSPRGARSASECSRGVRFSSDGNVSGGQLHSKFAAGRAVHNWVTG